MDPTTLQIIKDALIGARDNIENGMPYNLKNSSLETLREISGIHTGLTIAIEYVERELRKIQDG